MRWAAFAYFELLLFIPVVMIFFLFAFTRKKKALYEFARKGMIEKLTSSVSFFRQYIKASIIIFSMIFLIIALARPQYGIKEELVTQKGIDIILAIDTSYSMDAEDIKPARLARVKLAIKDLILKLQGDRVGIVAFSGESFLQCPLTIDYSAVDMMTDILNTGAVPKPGTNIEKAINVARQAFKAKERQYKLLIIMTDGEETAGNALEAAREAAGEGIVIYTIGLGSPEGAPIPVYDKSGKVIDVKKDRRGKEVISRLDEKLLKEIAKTAGGKYFSDTGSGKEVEEICKQILTMEKRDLQSNLYSNFEERFQYPLIAGFILLVIEFLVSERARPKKKWIGRFE
jgi:Ca-activated chloride channel family protein